MGVELVAEILSFLTLVSGILIVVFLGTLGARKILGIKKSKSRVWDFINENAVPLAFVVALTATLGSLYYSEILGYTPCKLCWFQRIMMYPLVLILGVNLIREDRSVLKYVVPMSIIGGAISAYHYIGQRVAFATSCGANSDVPCTIKYTFEYGYITIPMMALTAFTLILIAMLIYKKHSFKN